MAHTRNGKTARSLRRELALERLDKNILETLKIKADLLPKKEWLDNDEKRLNRMHRESATLKERI